MDKSKGSLFLSPWYLDVVSPNWSAVVWGDYESAFPLTIVSKAQINQIVQPIFTREFQILGRKQSLADLLHFLEGHYKNIDIRLSEHIDDFSSKSRIHQFLELSDGWQANYSTNAKRLIKKAQKKYTYKAVKDLGLFFELIKETLAHKIEEFTPHNLDKLQRLMQSAIGHQKGECIGVFNDKNGFEGAGFFFHHQNTCTYLKGAATHDAKKKGAMFGLIDFALQKYQNDYEILDFGGSEIDNVADFYRKFGAQNRTYFHYELNNLPFWYRWLRNMKLKK